MKMKNRFLGFQLILIGLLFMIAFGCEETPKKDPVITWANPADIVFGTLLSEQQLNATADVPGAFVYTPGIGTKLNAGTDQNLTADFTPTDAENYNSATKTVLINVLPSTTGTVTDIDGNVYPTVTIGTQVWMASNLKSTHYAFLEPIPQVKGNANWDALTTSSKAYCWYGDGVTDSTHTYGALYTWAAAMNGAVSSTANPSKVKGACPKGWHLPSDAEWTQLTDYLGGESISGGKLKEHDTTHWKSPNAGATNETGFTALPGGNRSENGEFKGLFNYGSWWTATENNAGYAWGRGLTYLNKYVYRDNNFKEVGFSVRCVKD